MDEAMNAWMASAARWMAFRALLVGSRARLLSVLFVTVLAGVAGVTVSSGAKAQSLSNPIPLQDSTFDYRALSYDPSASGFVIQANGEGAQRYLYAGAYVFSNSVTIYGRAASLNLTASYASFPRPASAAALVTTLNTRGASGELYLGDYSVSDSVTVNYSGNDTYTYRELPMPATEVDFLTQVNTQGAQGYAFLGNVGFSLAGGGFSFSSLFVKNQGANDVFTYETRNSSATASAFLTQAGGQGLLGFRYLGDYAFATSRSVYVKNTARQDRYFYEALNTTSSAEDFLVQANAMGARKYLFYGNMGFGSPTPQFASIYVSFSDILFTAGFE
ncbi:MAG: hypothetical protein IPK97_17025 [Ahniella sp.]|nr:hypothetical protein [Ahniella sp.]